MDNYRIIEARLLGHEPFQGNSMSAHRDRDGNYIVLSYATEIARVDIRGTWIIPENEWGPTTGRHINLCRRYL